MIVVAVLSIRSERELWDTALRSTGKVVVSAILVEEAKARIGLSEMVEVVSATLDGSGLPRRLVVADDDWLSRESMPGALVVATAPSADDAAVDERLLSIEIELVTDCIDRSGTTDVSDARLMIEEAISIMTDEASPIEGAMTDVIDPEIIEEVVKVDVIRMISVGALTLVIAVVDT